LEVILVSLLLKIVWNFIEVVVVVTFLGERQGAFNRPECHDVGVGFNYFFRSLRDYIV
jgi:hypothetical protein